MGRHSTRSRASGHGIKAPDTSASRQARPAPARHRAARTTGHRQAPHQVKGKRPNRKAPAPAGRRGTGHGQAVTHQGTGPHRARQGEANTQPQPQPLALATRRRTGKASTGHRVCKGKPGRTAPGQGQTAKPQATGTSRQARHRARASRAAQVASIRAGQHLAAGEGHQTPHGQGQHLQGTGHGQAGPHGPHGPHRSGRGGTQHPAPSTQHPAPSTQPLALALALAIGHRTGKASTGHRPAKANRAASIRAGKPTAPQPLARVIGPGTGKRAAPGQRQAAKTQGTGHRAPAQAGGQAGTAQGTGAGKPGRTGGIDPGE
jgi:hypothetical protein